MGITRDTLFRSLGVIKDGPELDKWTIKAHKEVGLKEWREGYSLGFRASMYPGGDKSCARQALYRLMGFPENEPISPTGRGIMDAGKAIEESIVNSWNELGILLGPKHPAQMRIHVDTLWLSGFLDAALDLRPDWKYVLPVEIKTKKDSVIDAMQVGAQSYDEQHYFQLQAYLFHCIKEHERMGWNELGLKPAIGGIIYYISRENPRNTHEFYVETNYELINNANEKLEAWRQNFLDDVLPERNKNFMWSKTPCQYCPFKKFICKPDHIEGINKLSESHGVQFAQNTLDSYNVDKSRKRVIDRWTIKQLEMF